MTYSHADFKGSPVEVARAREEALANGLRHLATCCYRVFSEPLQIDSNGEFLLVMQSTGVANWSRQFGKRLAAILSPNRPRMGTFPANSISELNSWCMMNHFDVERMLEQFEATEHHFLCRFVGQKSGSLGVCYPIADVKVFSVSTFEKIRLAVYKAGYESVSNLTYHIVEK